MSREGAGDAAMNGIFSFSQYESGVGLIYMLIMVSLVTGWFACAEQHGGTISLHWETRGVLCM